jgi:hypothetical protein
MRSHIVAAVCLKSCGVNGFVPSGSQMPGGFLGAAKRAGHRLAGQRRVTEPSGEGELVIAHRLFDDLKREVG